MHYFFCFAACLYKYLFLLLISSVMSDSLLPHGLQHTRPPVLHCLLELAQTHVHWVGDAIQPSHPLLPPSLALDLSQHQGLFQCFGSLHQVAKVLDLQLQNQSFQWIFRVDFLWIDRFPLDRLAVQGTLKSLLQHHNSKASILQHSIFFMIKLSHPYMITGKTIALTIRPLMAIDVSAF